MNTTTLALLIRHIIGAIGGGFVIAGYTDGETVKTAIGALSTLASVVWSIIEKRKRPVP